jgi:hypothetical protein
MWRGCGADGLTGIARDCDQINGAPLAALDRAASGTCGLSRLVGRHRCSGNDPAATRSLAADPDRPHLGPFREADLDLPVRLAFYPRPVLHRKVIDAMRRMARHVA